ncbi:uncharacterized protein [Palaemon carinicauda]|uniref:uncharacterized protein n=1 Tax=Palaemon carinicauda TaxID=392227 RepID=UPI0035B6247F
MKLHAKDCQFTSVKLLAKDCQFTSVTAKEACDSYVRDAFINGLVSGAIHQRLLENLTLNLNTAYEQARTLEMAQKHSASYSSAEPVNAAVSAVSQEEKSFSAENNRASGSSSPKYSAAMGASPKCLEKSITPLKLNGSPVSTLIDTGSSDSFVRHNLVDLNKPTMSPEHGKVSMAD